MVYTIGFSQLKIEIEDSDTTNLKYKWLGYDSYKMDTIFKIDYILPEGFIEDTQGTIINDKPNAFGRGLIVGPLKKRSKDGQAVASFFYYISTKEDEEFSKVFFNSQRHKLVDYQHNYQMEGLVRDIMGKKASLQWKKYFSYYSEKQARNRFNADMALKGSFTLEEKDQVDNFKYVDVFLIQKNGQGYVYYLLIYTDKAKNNIKKYFKALENSIKYRK